MNEKPAERPTCFVLMPIADVHGYEPGHFGRVYEHLLKPAIEQAGYTPVRADDTVKTDYIVVGIIQKIVESEMVICDLSARNPNVMYELGIRHAFNKPVALIKDRRTDKIFDIQGLRYTEYDDSLRVDSVGKDVLKIANSVKETSVPAANGVNSIVQLAGIKAAELPAGQKVSADTQLILAAIGALEKRVDRVETNSSAQPTNRFFGVADDQVNFPDSSWANIGDDVYDGRGNSIGVLTDIHPSEERIFIKQKDGKTVSLLPYSGKARGISGIPF